MSYTRFINFGSSTNNKIMFPEEPSNPLTYCLWNNSNSNYIHGATAYHYKPFCVECSTFMKEIGNGMHGYGPWGTININGKLQSYCEFYVQNNNENTQPNLSAINSEAFIVVNAIMKEKNSVGENLIRNTLELRFLNYLSACRSNKKVSFNPNIATSPYINIYNGICGNCPVIVNIPQNIDNDIIMNRALLCPKVSADVFAYIWAAITGRYNNVILNYPCVSLSDNQSYNQDRKALINTKLGKYLIEKNDYYANLFCTIQRAFKKTCSDCGCKAETCKFTH